MSRRRRQMETSEVALMAVMTKAMGAFLILMVFGMQYVIPDMTADEISKIIHQSLDRAKSDLDHIGQGLGNGGGTGQSSQAQAKAGIADVLKRLDGAAADLDQMRTRLDQAISQLRASEQERSRLAAENDGLKGEIDKERAQADDLKARLEALTSERDKLAADLKSLATARQALTAAVQALDQGSVSQATADAIRRQIDDALRRLAAAEAESAGLKAGLARAESEVVDLKGRLDQAKAENGKMAQDNENLNARVRALLAQVDRLTKDRDKAVAGKDVLRAENKNLIDELELAKRPVLFAQLRRGADCGDADLELIVSRLRPDRKGPRSIIRNESPDGWSPILRAGASRNSEYSKLTSFVVQSDTKDLNTASNAWFVDDGADGDRYAIYVNYVNALPGGDQKCRFDISLALRAFTFHWNADVPLEADEGHPFGANNALEMRNNRLRLIDTTDKEAEWLSKRMQGAKCEALACDIHSKAYRADLHTLVQKRYSFIVNAKKDAEPEERKTSIRLLDDLIDRFGDGQIKFEDIKYGTLFTCWVSKPGPAATASEFASIKAALAFRHNHYPNGVIDLFLARTKKGWWSATVAWNKLLAMGGPTDLVFKGLAAKTPSFANLVWPMVDKGIVGFDSGLEWVDLLARADTQASFAARREIDGAMRHRTHEAMIKKYLASDVIAVVDTLMIVGTVTASDIDSLLTRTEHTKGFKP